MSPTRLLRVLRDAAKNNPALLRWLAHNRERLNGPLERALSEVRGDVRIAEYVDWFKRNDAPYVMEERLSASGRTYEVKVYLPEAYTEDYMVHSDETGRLVRWGIHLTDGRMVSELGAVRLRFPHLYAKLKARLEKLRGEKRQEALSEALWGAMEPAEREAMVASLHIPERIDGVKSVTEVTGEIGEELQQSGSMLWYVRGDLELDTRVRNAFATKYLGGPIGSAEWAGASWPQWLAYKAALKGCEPGPLSIEALRSGATQPLQIPWKGRTGKKIFAPWVGATMEYFGTASLRPPGEPQAVASAIVARMGGPWAWGEVNPPLRYAREMTDADRRFEERMRDVNAREGLRSMDTINRATYRSALEHLYRVQEHLGSGKTSE